MLSKSIGQIVRVSGIFHVLFAIESEEPLSDTIKEAPIRAAINFVEVCCQHTAYITGRGSIENDIQLMKSGTVHAWCNKLFN